MFFYGRLVKFSSAYNGIYFNTLPIKFEYLVLFSMFAGNMFVLPNLSHAIDFIHASQNYNALSYDDKILDGFYDLYGILMDFNTSKMPSLVDLQVTPVSDNITWEAVLVNKVSDSKLLHLIQKALEMAAKLRSESQNFVGSDLVQKLAALVSDHMGGLVGDPDNMLVKWRSHSFTLKETLGSMVLPLGSLEVGLARHRALLFKVLPNSS